MQRLQGIKRLGLTGLTAAALMLGAHGALRAAALDLSTDYLPFDVDVDGAGIRIGWQRLITDTQTFALAAATRGTDAAQSILQATYARKF